ncbi:MAG: hypothetical protein EBR82_67655 [Caulobacteraceae bacterium]|nr:hypothetical protein [Caulobacteraceae bacterium]NDC56724.1 hypothetical protein [Alphaproteobacteria bacterium]
MIVLVLLALLDSQPSLEPIPEFQGIKVGGKTAREWLIDAEDLDKATSTKAIAAIHETGTDALCVGLEVIVRSTSTEGIVFGMKLIPLRLGAVYQTQLRQAMSKGKVNIDLPYNLYFEFVNATPLPRSDGDEFGVYFPRGTKRYQGKTADEWEEICRKAGKVTPEALTAFIAFGSEGPYHVNMLRREKIPGAMEALQKIRNESRINPEVMERLNRMGFGLQPSKSKN